MEDISKLIDLGKDMGLKGSELADFVNKRETMIREAEKQKQNIEREERAKEREERMKDEEYKENERQALIKIELAQKQIELAKINADSKTVLAAKSPDVKAKIPKLPSFNEERDNMDSYLKRFERFATNAKWPKGEWATNLSSLLQGKALDVYSRLSSEEATDYDKLSDALLKRYQLTEEGFRQTFRSSKQEIGETAGQFVVRLSNYLSRWMELGKVTENYAGLRDLVLREQFLTVSNRNLVLFLKERKIKSITEMIELAEQYNEAHSVSENPFKQLFVNTNEGRSDVMRKDNFRSQGPEGFRQQKVFKDRVCYGCGSLDHFIRDCPHKTFTRPNSNLKAASFEAKISHSEEESKTEKEITEIGPMQEKSAATCIVLPFNNHCSTTQCQSKSDTKKENATDFEKNSNAYHESNGLTFMPVREGLVGKIKLSVLRDSGCNSVLIKDKLVEAKEYTEKKVTCILADGTIRVCPVARINVITPFYVGQVEALIMDNPVYDLIIGNITGARSADNPNLDWKNEVSSLQHNLNK